MYGIPDFFILFVVIIDLVISGFNAIAVGRSRVVVRELGTKWDNVILGCGWIMAALGFTFVYMFIAALIISTQGAIGQEVAQYLTYLGYLAIIFPLLACGMLIWIDSIKNFANNPGVGSGAVAAWNTFAMVNNINSAIEVIPNILEALGGMMKGMKSDSNSKVDPKVIILAIIILIVCIAAGLLTTKYIADMAEDNYSEWSQTKIAAARENAA